MTRFEGKPEELLKVLSEGEIRKDLPPETTKDIASIALDVISSTVSGLIITRLDGTVCYANPAFCKLFGYSPDAIMGMNAAELFSTKEIRKFSDVAAIIDISKDDTEEFLVAGADGRSLTVEVAASNVTSSSGELVGRMASFVDISKRKEIELDREKLIDKLQDALNRIRILRGIIPICASCKKVRDDKGYWNELELYIKEHSEADFSHGICPDCAEKLYPDFYRKKKTSPTA